MREYRPSAYAHIRRRDPVPQVPNALHALDLQQTLTRARNDQQYRDRAARSGFGRADRSPRHP